MQMSLYISHVKGSEHRALQVYFMVFHKYNGIPFYQLTFKIFTSYFQQVELTSYRHAHIHTLYWFNSLISANPTTPEKSVF